MQRAVADAGGARKVERTGELRDERQRLVERRRRVVPNRDVERLAGDVLRGQVRGAALDARRQRRDDRRVSEAGVDQTLEFVCQCTCLFRREVESKNFDGGETVARGLVGAKHGAEHADAHLMQDPERSERGRRGKRSRVA
jgi:hypothetical protein